MNPEHIHDALNHLDDDLIQQADAVRSRPSSPRRPWRRWATLAACLCVVVAAALWFQEPGDGTQQWHTGFDPEDYFAGSHSLPSQVDRFLYRHGPNTSSESSLAESAIPYAEERHFFDQAALEAEAVIPSLPDYPLFHCAAQYLEDGSLYSLVFSWQRYDDPDTAQEEYGLLTVTVAPQPIQQPQDALSVTVDEEGNEIPPTQTVTLREGIQIFGQGGSRQEKTLTYETDQGWYQITGSWNDTPQDMAMLLDWFWDHPVDLTQFPMEEGSTFAYTHDLTEVPEVFQPCCPDFASFGYYIVSEWMTLKDNVPYSFDGIYAAHVSQEDAKNSTYQSTPGYAEIQLYLSTEPNAYEKAAAIGTLEALTQEDFLAALDADSTVAFFHQGVYCSLSLSGTATGQEVWRMFAPR